MITVLIILAIALPGSFTICYCAHRSMATALATDKDLLAHQLATARLEFEREQRLLGEARS